MIANRQRLTWSGIFLACCVAGCGEFDARFEDSSDGNTFGTLIDDRGNFTFVRDPDSGEVIRADANNVTITFPTAGQDFGVERDDGGSVEISPTGENDVLIAVRGDPTVGDLDLQVSRDALGALAGVVRENAATKRMCWQADETCDANQAFLDGACDVVNGADVNAIAEMIQADLEAGGEVSFSVSAISNLLSFYLELPVDCCLAWGEFRNAGDACAG